MSKMGQWYLEQMEQDDLAEYQCDYYHSWEKASGVPFEEYMEQYKPKEDKVAKAVDPHHYRDIIPGYQYFDMMDHILEGWEGSQALALGTAYKYMARLGKKDDPVQEIGKAIWYLKRLQDDIKENGVKGKTEVPF